MDDRLLDVEQTASELGLSVGTVYHMVSARRIPFVKIGNRTRFLESDLVGWIRENRVPALPGKKSSFIGGDNTSCTKRKKDRNEDPRLPQGGDTLTLMEDSRG